MLYLYRGNAVLLQHFRGYLHGRDLLCGAESVHRESKREESQRADVCAGGIIYPEIYLLVEEVGYRATLNLGRRKTEFYYVPNYFANYCIIIAIFPLHFFHHIICNFLYRFTLHHNCQWNIYMCFFINIIDYSN